MDRINQITIEIKRSMVRPGSRPLTNAEMRAREEIRRSIATGLKLKGLPVRGEYR